MEEKQNEIKEMLEELREEWEKCELRARKIEKHVTTLRRIGFDIKMCSLCFSGLVEDHNPEGTFDPEEQMFEILPELCVTLSELNSTVDDLTLAISRSENMIGNLMEMSGEGE